MTPRNARLLVSGLMLVGPLAASAAEPNAQPRLTANQVLATIDASAQKIAAEDDVLLQAVRDLTNPRDAKQLQASSGAARSADPVDNPSFPELLGLALDQGLVASGEHRSLRFSLSAFSFVQLVRPHLTSAEYDGHSWARRLGGAVTLGGLGEKVDRDGDGKPDDPLEAKSLNDSVGWEVSVRVFGSRDPRETKVAERIAATLQPRLADLAGAWSRFYRTELAGLEDENHTIARSDLDAFLARGEVRARLRELIRQEVELAQDTDRKVKDAERGLIVSLVGSGVQRKPELGPDKLAFGIRAAWGRGLLDHTFNSDWSEQDAPAGTPKPRVFKVAYKATGEILATVLTEPTTLSLSASYERYTNVPSAKHQTVAQVGLALTFPLAKGVAVPVSVKWANHRDLIEGQGDVIGNVGITVDLGDLRQPRAN